MSLQEEVAQGGNLEGSRTMRERLALLHERRPFQLPTSVFTINYQDSETQKHVAHCLDFDLVCVGDTNKQAEESLRLAIKTYIEFGLSKGWNEEIHLRAPQEVWDQLTPNTPLRLGEAIFIDSRSILVVKAEPSEPVAA